MSAVEPCVIEIIERGASADDLPIILPNEVRINGRPVHTSAEHPVIVNEINIQGPHGAVYVTLTLLARRVEIKHEQD